MARSRCVARVSPDGSCLMHCARQTSWTSSDSAWWEPVYAAPGWAVHRPQPGGSGQAGQQASHHHGNLRYRRDTLRHRVNRHDSVAFENLVDTLPAVGSQRAGPGNCLRSPVTVFSSGASSRTSQRVAREVRHGFIAMSRSMRRRTFTARNLAISICSGQTWMFLSPPPALSNSALADSRQGCPA